LFFLRGSISLFASMIHTVWLNSEDVASMCRQLFFIQTFQNHHSHNSVGN
jgi:hypothetical protein